ncbi:MAG: DUF6077 domain-containing protein, partial [Blastocatellia bacterium]
IMLFHRALLQSNALKQPFFTHESAFDVPGVPVMTVLHLMTSYEMLAAFSARLFHLDPLWVYQVGMAFAGSAIFPFVYYLLYREFGVGKWASVAGTLFAAVFLFVDGNVHRSLGNFAFVRMWQGKAIVFTILLPATILLVRAYLKRPGRWALLRLAMLGVCGVGLSEVGVYLLPVMVLALSLSSAIQERFSARSLKQTVLLWASMFYPLAIGAALIFGLLPERATRIFTIGYPAQWVTNLSLVIDTRGVLVRDVLIVLIAPLIALNMRDAFFILVFAALLCVIFANPLTASVWITHVFPASFWRLTYLFPLPFLFGLAVCSLMREPVRGRVAALRAALVLVIAFSTMHAMTSTTVYWVSFRHLHIERFLAFKSPFEYNMPARELAFSRAIGSRLQDKAVLSPEPLNCVLGLINPSIKFEDTRWDCTIIAFDNLQNPNEGNRRLIATAMVQTCKRSPSGDAAVLQSIKNGIDAIIVDDCNPASDSALDGLLDSAPGNWRIAARANGYILFLRGSGKS